jgi:hypothetical protein
LTEIAKFAPAQPALKPREHALPLRLASFDRLPQPLHGELNVLRLQFAPAFHFGLIEVFRKCRKYSAA